MPALCATLIYKFPLNYHLWRHQLWHHPQNSVQLLSTNCCSVAAHCRRDQTTPFRPSTINTLLSHLNLENCTKFQRTNIESSSEGALRRAFYNSCYSSKQLWMCTDDFKIETELRSGSLNNSLKSQNWRNLTQENWAWWVSTLALHISIWLG